MGDSCNVAARIESVAAKGTIQVSPQVRDVLQQFNLTRRFPLRKQSLRRVAYCEDIMQLLKRGLTPP